MKTYKMLMMSLFAGAIMSSCKHDNIKDQLGPDYCSNVVDPFSRNLSRHDTLNFTKSGYDTLKAKISGNLAWNITLRGRKSGAVKRYKGVTADVLQYWKGDSDTMAFFQKDEYVDYAFAQNCQPVQYKSVFLASNPDYSKFGYLIQDFDGAGITTLYQPTDSQNFSDSISAGITSVFPAIQGTKFARFAGTPNAWYFGAITINFLGNNKLHLKLGTNDPSSIFVNFFVNSNGVATNLPVLRFKETGKDRDLKFPVSPLPGWTFVSARLSDLGVIDLSKIGTMQFNIGPSDSGKPVDLSVDFIIFTKDKPLM
jgi:hypothetical protein